MSTGTQFGPTKICWQYHPRSSRHSEIASWCIAFDLLASSHTLRKRIETGGLGFSFNYQVCDTATGAKHPLHIAIGYGDRSNRAADFSSIGETLKLALTTPERNLLSAFPKLFESNLRTVLLAATSRATMTSVGGATSRLFDSFDATRAATLASSPAAIFIGYLTCNVANECFSPTEGRVVRNSTTGPYRVLDVIRRLETGAPLGDRKSNSFGVSLVDCRNDTAVRVRILPNETRGAKDLDYERMNR